MPGRTRIRGGGWDEGWTERPGLWGEIRAPTGRTFEAAAQLQAEVSAEIVTRYRAAYAAGQRLENAGVTYEIVAPLPDNTRSMIVLLCKTVKPDAPITDGAGAG
ncbi:phage head closure protein [Pseudomonas sp. NPDC086581]|uniref:phage head closure protein n=1 Tax=Pseudomonas sp. NPDC086581 TaxID=3364432 RepID=UPI00382A5B97